MLRTVIDIFLIKIIQLMKQILNSLGYISIQISREYSDTHLYIYSELILTCFVIKHIF